MAYKSELEARLAKKTTKAIVDFDMLADGDRVMVGLSGGKDSWALLQILDVLRQRAPVRFTLIAVNVDSGYKEYKHDLIASTCIARGWEYRIEHTGIGELIDDILDDGATPCSLCARLRRGVLYRIAKEVGATKIALGHHADDFIETLLLNLFFAGALKAMPAKLVSDDGAHVVIRPLVYAGEDEARAYTKESELPIIGCCCPACGDLGLQRQRAKRLLMELEREHPGVKQSMLKALGNVAPRHLLDTRLNPPAELKVRLKAEKVRLKADATKEPPELQVRLEAEKARLKVDTTKELAELTVRRDADTELAELKVRLKADTTKEPPELQVRLEAEKVRLKADTTQEPPELKVRLEAEKVRLKAEKVRLKADTTKEDETTDDGRRTMPPLQTDDGRRRPSTTTDVVSGFSRTDP